MRATRAAALAAVVIATAGCGDDAETVASTTAPAPCKLGFLGDEGQPVAMTLVARDADGNLIELQEGGDVSMILPPQGGRVIFVGAVATNLDACAVQLSGVLRDTTSGQIRIDERTTNLKPDGSGWGGPVAGDISTFSNIPLCPNQWATTAVFDNPFELTVSVTDKGGRTASAMVHVVPRCNELAHQAECLCQCQEDYMLGQTCP
jgi:hypothetical protein